MRLLSHKELVESAKVCINKDVVFIGNDIMPANCGKIVGMNEDSESFLIRLNNDKSVYEIPFINVMFHTLEDFKEWVLESIYDKIAQDYGLPPVAEMILADYQKRETQKQEKIKMAEEKKAVKVAKEEAKKAAEVKKAEKKAEKENADKYGLVLCKKNVETKKAEYSKVSIKNEKVLIGAIKELLLDASVTSIQILVRK